MAAAAGAAKKKVVSLHWFRKGLRIHDNPALLRACEGAEAVYPVFIIDPHFVKPGHVGKMRYNFLLEALRDLDSSLRTRFQSRLFVARGNPVDVLPALVNRWSVTRVTFERDTEPYALSRDTALRGHFTTNLPNVEFISVHGHTLWNPADTIAANQGRVPLTYQSFLSIVGRMPPPLHHGEPRAPMPPPKPEAKPFSEAEFGVPTLEEMGYPPLAPSHVSKFPGGETHALERMAHYIKKRAWICAFEKPKTSPNSLEPSTTVLSPYLKFGCLSARLFEKELRGAYEGQRHAQPPVSLLGQLYWREFFYTAGFGTPNFDRMQGNSICRQIPWGDDPALLAAWREGRTGFPFIDAIMTQLREEGWIHHLARHMVACFLTRGDLWQSWEKGAAVFEELLLDADWSLNNANWMWLSCSSFFYQYFRVYSPIAFGKKTDPNGDYIRRYLPVLRKFPAKYIYQPWEAPRSVQTASGCVIGTDYPAPIVDHAEASKACMARMQAAYAAHSAILAQEVGAKGGKRGAAGDGEEGMEPDDDEGECGAAVAKEPRGKRREKEGGEVGKGAGSAGPKKRQSKAKEDGKGDGAAAAKMEAFLKKGEPGTQAAKKK